MELLTIIVPSYNEEEALPLFYAEITKLADEMDYIEFEFLFIDDGSKDKTLEVIKQLASKDKRVRYISFSRNFGKEAAIFAGLSNSKGDYVALLDADLQDPPCLLKEMYDGIVKDGYDCVAARRTTRTDEPPVRSFFAKLFYKLMSKISEVGIVDGARDFRLMKRQVVDAIISLCEYNRFSKGIFSWVGFKTKYIPYVNVERIAGKTKWSFINLFLYSIEGIVSFSTMPLAISSFIGIIFFVISCIAVFFIIAKTLIFGDPVAGWPTLICVIFMVSGVQLFCTGILGQYLAKTYLESKKRPMYIIKENNGKEVN